MARKFINGLKTQFWCEQKVPQERKDECEVALTELNKTIAYTVRDLKASDRNKIIGSAKEIMCWKLVADPQMSSYNFIGFFLDSRGLCTFNPYYIFVHESTIYGFDSGYRSYKFSSRLNYESVVMMLNVIQSEHFGIAPSHQVMKYIEAEMKQPTKGKVKL